MNQRVETYHEAIWEVRLDAEFEVPANATSATEPLTRKTERVSGDAAEKAGVYGATEHKPNDAV